MYLTNYIFEEQVLFEICVKLKFMIIDLRVLAIVIKDFNNLNSKTLQP